MEPKPVERMIEEVDTLRSIVDEKWSAGWKWTTREVPDQLFHYTPTSGLRGILESGVLWATNGQFLNDESELRHGADIASSVLSEIARESGEGGRHFLQYLSRTLNADYLFDPRDVYVTCLCESSDLLSQWRAYSAEGGASIGLAELSGWKIDGQAVLPKKVIYDLATQEAMTADILRPYAEFFDRNLEYGNGPGDRAPFSMTPFSVAAEFIRQQCSELLLLFKHPAFREESEWRITRTITFSRSGQHEGLHFRQRGDLFIPYIELPIRGRRQDLLPIREITISPSANSELRHLSILGLADSFGYSVPNTFIRYSSIPLRD